MSKPSLSSLLIQVTELTTQFAALSAHVDTILAAAAEPAAPAPAEVKVKKTRVKKNPDAPKRAPGAYVRFCQAERAKTPDLKLQLKELGTRWRALTDEERASFKPAEPAAAQAKPTFQEAREVAATMSSTVAVKFMRFCVQNPTLSAKTAAARFKALSPEEKAKFNDDGDDTSDDDDSSDEE